MRAVGHFIGGKEVKGTSGRTADVFEPMTGDVQAKVALASKAEVRAAVENARASQPEWAATNPQRRARVMMKFVELVQRDYDKLAELLAREHGKTVPDAKGDIQRGLEVAEFACGIPHLMTAPAAGRGRRHHPVQLPGDDPAVEGGTGAGLRERLRAQAERA